MIEQQEIQTQICQIIAAYMGDRLKVNDLPADADIRDYGVDSLDALELFAEIERHFGIRLPGEEIDFSTQNTLEELTRLVVTKTRSARERD